MAYDLLTVLQWTDPLRLEENLGSAGSTPRPESCLIKQCLVSELQEAHTRLVALHNREMEYILRGDFAGCKALSGELEEARKQRESIVDVIHQHLTEHGCGSERTG